MLQNPPWPPLVSGLIAFTVMGLVFGTIGWVLGRVIAWLERTQLQALEDKRRARMEAFRFTLRALSERIPPLSTARSRTRRRF